MKAALVFPKVSNYDHYNSKLIRVPLGLLTVATRAKQAGAEVFLIDERRCPDAKEEIQSLLKKHHLDCVGFSVMTGNQIHFAKNLSRFVKSISPVPIVWGGVHPTLDPVVTCKDALVDYVVVGEGEDIFVSLLAALSAGSPIETVRGIAFQRMGEVVLTEASVLPDLDSNVGVDYSLLPYQEYRETSAFFNFESDIILPVETSRGCPFSCTFCTEPAMARGWRTMSVASVLEEVQRIKHEYGTRAISFVDDLFFVRHEHTERIINALIAAQLDIEWYANVRAEYVVKHGREYFAKVAAAGCRSLTMGAEGGTNEVLKRVRKGAVTVQKLLEANRILRDVGIAPHFSSIIGYPNEEEEEVCATIDMAWQLLIENSKAKVSLNKLIPTPGSIILRECVSEGFISPLDLDGWAEVFYTDAREWLLEDSAEFISRLYPLMELIGMVNCCSPLHDGLFQLLNALRRSDASISSLFACQKATFALDEVLASNENHFRRYPIFGDERNWSYR